MTRRPGEEPLSVYCELCGSHGLPAGEGYCEICRPARARYLAELEQRGLWPRARRRFRRLTGLDPDATLFAYLLVAGLLAGAVVLLAASH